MPFGAEPVLILRRPILRAGLVRNDLSIAF
jgi:hypothetical protein